MSDRARYWQRLVAAWEKSGLSQAEFCRRRKITAVNFGWWKRKLESVSNSHPKTNRSGSSRTGSSPRSAKPGFVEFRMTHAAAAQDMRLFFMAGECSGCRSSSIQLS